MCLTTLRIPLPSFSMTQIIGGSEQKKRASCPMACVASICCVIIYGALSLLIAILNL
jgi:hypothetical protein